MTERSLPDGLAEPALLVSERRVRTAIRHPAAAARLPLPAAEGGGKG